MRYLVAALIFLAMNAIAMAETTLIGPARITFCNTQDAAEQFAKRIIDNNEDGMAVLTTPPLNNVCTNSVVMFETDQKADLVHEYDSSKSHYKIFKIKTLLYGEQATTVHDVFVSIVTPLTAL